MDISDPPFASEPDGKTPTGLDVDLANALAAELGTHVQIVPLSYDGLYDALKVGAVDGLISALPIDLSRTADVIYSPVYFDNGLVLTAPGAGSLPQQMADLDGKRVAVEYGSLADETARLWQRRLHSLDEQLCQTADEALDAARSGQSDAALTDAVTARLYIRSHGGLMLHSDYVTSEPYAVAVRKSSFMLADALGHALDQMQANGTLQHIIDPWL